MQRQRRDARVAREDGGRSITLMHVAIDHQRRLDAPLGEEHADGDRDIVEGAEPGALLGAGMMAAAGGVAGESGFQRKPSGEDRGVPPSRSSAARSRARSRAAGRSRAPRRHRPRHARGRVPPRSPPQAGQSPPRPGPRRGSERRGDHISAWGNGDRPESRRYRPRDGRSAAACGEDSAGAATCESVAISASTGKREAAIPRPFPHRGGTGRQQRDLPMNDASAPAAGRAFAVTHRGILAIAVPMTLAYLSTPLLGITDMAVIGRIGGRLRLHLLDLQFPEKRHDRPHRAGLWRR